VFYRIHAQSRPLEEALRVANVPYVIVGGVRFYDRAEVKDLLAYLRLLLNPNDDVSLLRVVNVPPRKIGKTTLDRMQAHAYGGTSLWKLIAARRPPGRCGPRGAQGPGGLLPARVGAAPGGRGRDHAPRGARRLDVYERTGYRAMLEADGRPRERGPPRERR
jgi:DNA helicase-2/ATP-dependent DNA helicase PcrA